MAKRQLEIAGTEQKRIKEVVDAAEAYVEQRDKRIALSAKEKAQKAALVEVMKKHSLTVYRDMEADPHDVAAAAGGEQSLTAAELEVVALRSRVAELEASQVDAIEHFDARARKLCILLVRCREHLNSDYPPAMVESLVARIDEALR